MAILLNGWILTTGGVASGTVCACSLPSRLFFSRIHVGRTRQALYKMTPLYRVVDHSCHPQISLCARFQKKTESWTGHPLKWLSPGLSTRKIWQSPELATPKLTIVGDIFWGGKSSTLSFQRAASSELSFSGFWHIGKGEIRKSWENLSYNLTFTMELKIFNLNFL